MVYLSLDQKMDHSSPVGDDSSFDAHSRNVVVSNPKYSQKILVVDDEQDIVFTLKTILTEAGFSVDAFTNPSIAFED
jgi:PleD family two-component response regulator